MTRPSKPQRFTVTGPGLDPEPSYADPGPALSRALTAACSVAHGSKGTLATFYARDSITGDVVGYAETDENGHVAVRRH